MTPSVTFAVVAYHRPDSLRALLKAVGGDARIETIVVNVDDDAAVAAVAAEAGAATVPLPGNPGFAAAVNAAARVASTSTVVFSNDDVATDAAAVLALAGAAGDGVAVPHVVDPGGRTQPTIAALPGWRSLAVEWLLLPDRPVPGLRWAPVQKWRAPVAAEPVAAASATVVAVRTALLRDVPLPEQYFLYWEEMDWFARLARRGVAVWYRPEIVVTHRGGRAEVRADKARLLSRNAVRCVRATRGRAAAAAAWPVVVAWSVRLAVLDIGRAAMGSAPARRRVRARLAGVRAATAAVGEIR